MSSPRTLVAGHVDIDTIVTASGEANDVLGGSALYASVAASLHESPVGLVSTVCPDDIGSRLDDIADRRLAPDLVPTLGSQRRNHMDYTADVSGPADRLSKGHSREVWGRKCEMHAPRHPPAGYGTETEVIHLSPMLPRYQRLYAEWATERGLTVSLDSSEYYTTNFADELNELLPLVDWLLLSKIEVAQLLPGSTDDARTSARTLLAEGPDVVAVRQGEDGCLVTDGNCFHSFDALPATVVDPTGAGDSFNGGFVSAYPSHGLAESCKYAIATAKRCIEAFGTAGLLDSSRRDVERDVENVRRSS